jgi:hypothetical protein
MDQRRIEKMLKTNQRVEEKLRQRWLEDGENDLRELKVKRWIHKPNIREEWTSVLKWNNVEDLGVEK